MSTEETAPAAPATETETAPVQPAATPPEKDWKSETEKWQALARKNEERAKANADKAKRFDEFEEASKTEAQKLAERAASAEKAAAVKDAELLRLRTALKHGISDEDAETFLTGSDEETLTKQAERLVALQGPPGPRTPAPDPSQGSRGGNLPDTDALIREAQAKGDWRTVISLQNQKLAKTN